MCVCISDLTEKSGGDTVKIIKFQISFEWKIGNIKRNDEDVDTSPWSLYSKMSIKLKKKKNSTNTKRSGLVLTMILFSPLQWHFYFFWILPLPSPSGICGQSHLELPELLAKSFCREGELAAFSWTVEGRRNANYNCKLYFGKPKKKKNRWLLFGPQFWKGQRKTSLLRKRQRVYLGCLLRKDYQLLEAVTIVKHFFFF